MKITHIIAALLIFLLLFFSVSCNVAPSSDPSGTDSPYADSPYQALKAYVSYVTVGQSTAGFKIEREFRHPAYSPPYEDLSVPQVRTLRLRNTDHTITYNNSKKDPYLNCTLDSYWGKNGSFFEFDRATQRLTGHKSTNLSKCIPKSIFDSASEIITTAKQILSEYIDEDLSGYTATLTHHQNYVDIRLSLYSDGIIVSRLSVFLYKSGDKTFVSLQHYRENAAAIVIPEGTDAQGRTAVEARVEENRAAREAANDPVTYEGYEILTGILYYDEENRPYILYRVHFEYEYAAECADFIVYIE